MMKLKITPWLVVYGLCGFSPLAHARVWYVSGDGSDAGPGSVDEPLRTVAQALSGSGSGDTILLARGDVFRESGLAVSDGRSLDAYGDEADSLPVLCGSRLVSGWSEVAGEPGVWQANFAASVAKGEPSVFVNGERQTLARYPDTGWLRIDAGSDAGKIVDAALRGDPTAAPGKWKGGQVRWRKWSWWYETRPITADSGTGTLTLGGTSAIANLTGIDGGYYIDNRRVALNAPGEWYWDRGAGKLYLIPPGDVDPATMVVEVAVAPEGLTVSGGASLRNVHVRHYTDVGIGLSGAAVVEDCLIEHIWNHGISGSWGAAGAIVRGNIIRDILNVGISWNENPSGAGGSVIERNHLVRCGTVPGLGGSGPWRAAGAIITNAPFGAKGVQFRLNRIEGTGYAGIILGRNGQTVERNVFRDTMNTLNDGAAIYTNCSYSFIRENIILETEGDLESSHPWTPLGAGIWLEFLSNFRDSVVVGNTVYGCGGDGLFLPNNFNCLIEDNIFLSNLRGGATLGGHEEGRSDGQTNQNHIFRNNLFGIGAVPWSPTQPRNLAPWGARNDVCLIFKTHPDRDLDFGRMSGTRFLTLDGLDLVENTDGGKLSIASWQSAEAAWADPNPRVVEGAGYLFINDTESTVDFPLPANVEWMDLSGVAHAGVSVPVEPFRSVVLLSAQGVVDGLPGYRLYSELEQPVLWLEWLDRYMLAGDLSAAAADADEDGAANVIEYLADTSPVDFHSVPRFPIIATGSGAAWHLDLRAQHPEWTVTAEWSPDMNTWSPLVMESDESSTPPGMTRRTVGIPSESAAFLRLSVTLAVP